MSAAAHQLRYTPEEYLALEHGAEYKSDYYDGEIFARAGASPQHNFIAANVTAVLLPFGKRHGCRGFGSDMRINVEPTGLYTYADFGLVCGEPIVVGPKPGSLTNPTLIVEVLSPSTESLDRTGKFQHYCHLESLEAYLLIAQDQPQVTLYHRLEDGSWAEARADGLDGSVRIPLLELDLALADVYDLVELPG